MAILLKGSLCRIVTNLINMVSKKPAPKSQSPATVPKKPSKSEKLAQDLDLVDQAVLDAESEALVAYEVQILSLDALKDDGLH